MKVLKKPWLWLVLLVVAMAGIVIAISLGKGRADPLPSPEEIKESHPLLKEASYKGRENASQLPGIEGSVHVYADDRYSYYVSDNGFILRIDDVQGKDATYPETASSDFGTEQASAAAQELFDSVFYREESILGKEKTVTVSDFSGVDYQVTIVLLREGTPSGHKASISYAGDGRLISAMFIRETTADYSGDTLTEERAKELALDYFYQHYKELKYVAGEELLEVTVGKAEYLIHKGKGYWDVEVTAVYTKEGHPDGKVTDPGSIRIKANNGEYVWFASTFK